jgi:hypothetical protein
MTERTIKSLRQQDYEHELPPPPQRIRLRFLELLESLRIDWRTSVPLPEHERRFRREIVRWVMGDLYRGARRSLPAGYVVHAWMTDDPTSIVVMRTR